VTVLSFLLIWLGLGVFAAASVARAVRYARAPVHLRWELYPVPHEAPERAAHGGSRYEEPEWWAKPPSKNLLGELAYMLPEMLLLAGLRQHNRRLWYRSYPFHLGLYLVAAAGALLGTGAMLDVAGVPLGDRAAHVLTAACDLLGAAGVVLGTGGALALLHARLTDAKLAAYSAPADYFNLALFAGVLPLAGLGFLLEPAPSLLVAARVVRFDTAAPLHPVLASGLALASLTAAYIPLTHMSHFVGKWFTYHNVRWDDGPDGERLRARMAEYLTYRPTWSAPHILADGTRSWRDVAGSNPTRGGER
jgi:nitrate reductase gamma subunit